MNMRTDVDVYIYERLISYLSKIAKEQNLAEEDYLKQNIYIKI